MANNFDRLKDEADIAEVVENLNMETHNKGNNYFVLCPIPSHNDTHPTNCYFKKGWNNLYCTACGTTIKAIDLIMYETGCTYGEAADRLWELEGRPDWYRDKKWRSRQKKEKIEFSITPKEANLIGIKLPKKIMTPVECHSIKLYPSSNMPKGKVYDPVDVDNFLVCEVNQVSYKDFIDEDAFKYIVFQKAKERLYLYQSIQNFFKDMGIEVKLFIEEQKAIMEIINRLVSTNKAGGF